MKLLFTLILMPLFCNSQVVVIDKTDEFTDHHIIKVNCAESDRYWYDSDKITKGLFNQVYLCAYQDLSKEKKETLYFTLQCMTGGLACIDASTRAIFIFDDTSKIEIKNFGEIKCDHTQLLPYFEINRHDLEIFATKKVIKFRVYFSDGYRDYEVKDKKQDKVRETFALLKSKI